MPKSSFGFYFDYFDSSSVQSCNTKHTGRLLPGIITDISRTSLQSSVPQMTHGTDPVKVPVLKIIEDRIVESLVHVENVLNISNAWQSMSLTFRTHFSFLAGENHPILQLPIEGPDLTAQQCEEFMAVVSKDIWNLVCLGCREPRHSLFTFPIFTKFHTFYFRTVTSINMWKPQLVAKW